MLDPASRAIIPGTGIRKFVDTLPGLNTPNGLGQMVPVANADAVTFPGSDYYEIAVTQYQEQMHTDLPATTLRGYVQLNNGTDANGNNAYPTFEPPLSGTSYCSQRDRPVHQVVTSYQPEVVATCLFLWTKLSWEREWDQMGFRT